MNDAQTKVKGSLYKPPVERPEDTQIALAEYIEDAKVRWQIHLYEWNEFTTDILVPFAKTTVSWTKTAVERVKEAYHSLDSSTSEVKTDDKVVQTDNTFTPGEDL